MRAMLGTVVFALAIGSAAVVSGCKKADSGTVGTWAFGGAASPGRYADVGIYTPSVAWTKMAAGQAPRSASAAALVDDEAIIVVTDSQTGEVRACGDLSGYCVGMSPWQAGLAKSQVLPVNLTKHGNPIVDEAANTAASDATAAESDSNSAMPTSRR